MQRRQLFQAVAGAALAGGHARLFAAPAAQSRFLFVFLRGGCDAASVLPPIASDFYYDARPTIAIARPSAHAVSALPLDAYWGMHPALSGALGPLLSRGELAFVPLCGTDDLSRSHFETQGSIELGLPLTSQRDYRSGFLGRLVTAMHGGSPIAFTQQLPLAFRDGSLEVPNVSLQAVSKPTVDARQSAIIEAMYEDSPWAVQVQEGFAVRNALAREMAGASPDSLTARGFELEARRIARLMSERYTLGFVDVGGWDTHVSQGAATGYLAKRLEELGRGLSAFAAGMGPLWPQTTVVVMSEFGRTLRENGNRGTDHGHGGVMWVLGGATKRAPVVGRQVMLTRETLFQDRDWPVLNDYRSVLGGIFRVQFGLSDAQLQLVFPGTQPVALGLV